VRDERLSLLFPLRSLLFSSGDDRNRQDLRVGDPRPHITAMPQLFHQRVNHDKSGYYAASDRRLFLAMMLCWSGNRDHARGVGGRQPVSC